MAGKVFITGDKHGSFRTFFGLSEKGITGPEDVIIITGDAGYVWDEDYHLKIETLEQLIPGTICFIDGNHENHALLNSLEVCEWHGGKVHRAGQRVYHLMRGEIYDIFGERYFCFGGARTVSRFVEGIEGVDWWIGEEASAEELEYGEKRLFENPEEIDYVITHESPLFARDCIDRPKRIDADYVLPAVLEDWYKRISAYDGRFKKWYFGHMHVDQIIRPDLRAIHNNVVEAGSEVLIKWV